MGEGGTGSVYKALERDLNRVVALKILHDTMIGDEESRERFRREGKILSSLSHPNLLVFYRFGIWQDAYPYICMEFLKGTSLRELVDSNSSSCERLLHIALQICDAMQSAHTAGIIHRDLKPNNVMLLSEPADFVKIVDFGLARRKNGERSQHLTQTGMLVGSVHYMSPEQCAGRPADNTSDIYSLGCMLYELFCGQPPFSADNPIGLMHKHVSEEPERLSSRKGATTTPMPEGLEFVIHKCLEKDCADRYKSMVELSQDLQMVVRGRGGEFAKHVTLRPKSLRWKGPATLTVTVLLIAGLGFAAWQKMRDIASIQSASSIVGSGSKHVRKGFTSRSANAFSRMGFFEQIAQSHSPRESVLISREYLHCLPQLASRVDFDSTACIYAITCVCANYRLNKEPEHALSAANSALIAIQNSKVPMASLLEKMRIWQGKCLLWNGQVEQAKASFKRTLSSVEPLNEQVLSIASLGVAECYIEQRKLADAEKILLSLQGHTLDTACESSIALNLGRIMAARKNFSEASKLFSKAMFLDNSAWPYSQQATHLESIGDAFASINDKAKAAHFFHCALDLDPQGSSPLVMEKLKRLLPSNNASQCAVKAPPLVHLENIAKGIESKTEMTECLEYLHLCETAAPLSVDYNFLSQFAKARVGRPYYSRYQNDKRIVDRCLSVLLKARARRDCIAQIYCARAQTLAKAGHQRESIQEADKALAELAAIGVTEGCYYLPLSPTPYFEACFAKALCLEAIGSRDAGIALLEKIKTQGSLQARCTARLNLAAAYKHNGNIEQAEQELNFVAAVTEDRFMAAEGFLALSALYREWQKPTQALKAAESARKVCTPGQMYRAWLEKASSYKSLQDLPAEMKSLEEAVLTAKDSVLTSRIQVSELLKQAYEQAGEKEKADRTEQQLVRYRQELNTQ